MSRIASLGLWSRRSPVQIRSLTLALASGTRRSRRVPLHRSRYVSDAAAFDKRYPQVNPEAAGGGAI
jgi:hypothetical protein